MHKALYSQRGDAFRKWLKNQREGAGLTMRELGQKLDVPHQFIGKVEGGERRLDVVEYLWYCEAIGCDPADGLRVMYSLE